MFYIYSPQGRLFSGPMESLRKVKRTNGYPLISDDRDSEPSEKTQHVERYQVSEKAISEYHTMLKGSSVNEPVYHAYEIMSQPVVTLQTNDNWEKALDLFDRHSHHLLPVLNSRRALVATLSRSHFFRVALPKYGHHESLKNTKVFQLVGDDTEVISADPVTDIRRIATVMIDNELQAVPIVEEAQRLVGIVSRTDILKQHRHCRFGVNELERNGFYLEFISVKKGSQMHANQVKRKAVHRLHFLNIRL